MVSNREDIGSMLLAMNHWYINLCARIEKKALIDQE